MRQAFLHLTARVKESPVNGINTLMSTKIKHKFLSHSICVYRIYENSEMYSVGV